MNHIEDLLRDEFRNNDRVVVPTRDAMMAGVRRARRRRRTFAGAGVGAILAAASVVVASIVSSGLPRTTYAGTSPPRQSTAELINAIFTDAQHGYAVAELCTMDIPGEVAEGAPTPDVHRVCASQLLATADGGRTWQKHPLPGEPAIKDAGVELVQGHSLMFWVDDSGRLALGGWNRRYWTTTDGGSTWTESPTPRAVGPAGSFGAFGPDDRLTFLTSPPPEVVSDKERLVGASDGSFWIPCSVGNCVHVTRDHGASWPGLSTVDTATAVEWVASPDGHTVYAGVRWGASSQVARSTDGGLTWSVLLNLPWSAYDGIALPNGDLLVVRASVEGGVYRLAAGASSLVPVADAPPHPMVLYRSAGVLVAPSMVDVASVGSVSTDDGVTWRTIPAPA